MKAVISRYHKSPLKAFVKRHEKYLLIAFFIGGFIFDSLTLGRIDRLYDLTILSSHMTLLTACLYIFNRIPDGRWDRTLIHKYAHYFPLAIQFFFGALSSAYVVYFSRSVSLSKTMSFFVILVVLFFANELLKKRISNKYLQFGLYLFISITFFSFIIPVFVKAISPFIFVVSGLTSLGITLTLVLIVYRKSPSTRAEVKLGRLLALLVGVYAFINCFYFFRLIPPVPLALNTGLVAHAVQKDEADYQVTYEKDAWYVFWRSYRPIYERLPQEPVYIFTSIFAPTDIKKEIFHRWKAYNPKKEEWQTVEDISYPITGGRDGGYRGYTTKQNVWPGLWSVEVLTEEELVLGVIDFEIVAVDSTDAPRLSKKTF